MKNIKAFRDGYRGYMDTETKRQKEHGIVEEC